jgi:hypothetical protein
MILFWGCRVFSFANLLILVDRCSCPIDQWVGQLFPLLCLIWCDGHCVFTILVMASMWRKLCQTLDLKAWYCEPMMLGFGESNYVVHPFLDHWQLDVKQGMFKLCMKTILRLPWNHHLISIHWHAFGGQFTSQTY